MGDYEQAPNIEHQSRDLKRSRENTQKKTFTRWINRFLSEPDYRIKDLFVDLRDGRRLIRLVEILQKVSIGRPNNARLRVQKVDNVSRALDVLRSTRKKVRDPRTGAIREGAPVISGIGNENIVDGDVTLTLGLIWQMIRHYHIAMIAEELAANDQGINQQARSVNEALLLWCQQKTKGYPNCNITDFHKSWNDGMAFNALLHAHRPEAFDYDKLKPKDSINNLNYAFNTAEDQFGVQRLLDAEDVAVEVPDEKSIIIYVTDMYSALNKAKTEETGSKRVTNFLNDLNKTARNVQRYEANVDDLFNWIKRTIGWLNGRDLPNNIAGLQEEKRKFNSYLQVEKFEKFGDLTTLEVLLYDIQTLQRKEGHRVYAPKPGKTLEDLGIAWNELEAAEQAREKALVDQLLRQLELEKKAKHYSKVMLPARLKTMAQLKAAIEAMEVNEESMKDIEDVWERLIGIQSAIVNQKEIRFEPFYSRAKYLIDENFHDKAKVAETRDSVQAKWDELMEAFKAKEAVLKPYADIVAISKEVDALRTQLQLMHDSVSSTDTGSHLYGAEDLLAKHQIAERELVAVHDQIQKLTQRAHKLTDSKSQGTPAMTLSRKLFSLEEEYLNLLNQFNNRRAAIELSRDYHQLVQSCEDEEAWLTDKQQLLQSDITSSSKDLRTARKLLNRLKVEEAELRHRRSVKFAHLSTAGDEMRQRLTASPDKQAAIVDWLQKLRKQWEKLQQLLKAKQSKANDDVEAQQFYAAANEADDYINELLPIVRSADIGEDVGSASALLKRHGYLLEEVNNFGKKEEGELRILQQMAALLTVAADKHKIDVEKLQRTASRGAADKQQEQDKSSSEQGDQAKGMREEEEEEEEDPLIAVEEPYEELITETKVEDIDEPRRIQRVLVNHGYQSRDPKQRDLSAEKGEIFELLQKTNKDWYSVRDLTSNKRGFLPAVYLTEIAPATITVKVPKPIEVQRKVTKSRTVYKKASELSSKQSSAPSAKANKRRAGGASGVVRRASLRTADTLHSDKENIAKRMSSINDSYEQLASVAELRSANLRDAVKQFRFFQLANAFSKWLTDKEAVFSAEESLADNSAAIKKRYEKHFQEMAANKSRLDEIDTLAKDLLKADTDAKSSQQRSSTGDSVKSVLKRMSDGIINKPAVQKLHKDILDRWDRLNKLKIAKEKKLADSSSIERFAKRADETKDQLEEKLDLLNEFKELGHDPNSNAILINKHKGVLRDLDLLRKRVTELDYEGKAIKEVHPNESKFIDDKLDQLHRLLDNALDLAERREDELNNKQEKLAIEAATKKTMDDLNNAIDAVLSDRGGGNRRPTLADISDEDIENLLARTDELEREVDRLLEKNPNDPQLLALKQKLQERKKELIDALAKRKRDRANVEQLQKFLADSDRLLTKLHNLDTRLDNLQPSELADPLRAQCKELENVSSKLDKYADLADDLVDRASVLKPRYNEQEADKIEARAVAIDEAIVRTKAKCQQKADELKEADEFASFKEKADELAEWLAEKRIAVDDKSHRDLTNLPSKKQRHRAFEAELAANKPLLDTLRKEADAMQAKKRPKSKSAQDYVTKLEKQWADLESKSNDKGSEIDEALKEQELLRQLADGMDQLDKLDKEASRNDEGKDLRSARALLNKQKSMEQSLEQCKQQIDELSSQGKALAKQGHYDADKIMKSVNEFENAYNRLLPKAEQRRQQLEDSLAYRQFEFDRERECEWIDEHTPMQDGAEQELGRSLGEAQMLKQRHANLLQEVANHQPAFDKVLSAAKPLSNGRHAKPSAELAGGLANKIDRLNNALLLRQQQLDNAVKMQQYAADIGDIEQQLGDCALVLGTLPEAKDPITVDKNLKKLKSLEEELSALKGQLAQLESRKPSEGLSQQLEARQSELESRLGDLQRRARSQRKELHNRKEYEDFVQDVEEMREWIDNYLVPASSDDYGADFDHARQLQENFDQLVTNLPPAEAKVNSLKLRAEKLISSGNANAPDILNRATGLQDYWQQLQSCVEQRQAKLAKAIEIHQYNKEAYDFQQRLDEKRRNIPKEVGKDMDTLENFMKRHSVFVQELFVLDDQLKVLREQAEGLQARLDPANADRVRDRQRIVEEKYEELEELQRARVRQLDEAHDFFDFMKQKQAVKSWIDDGVIEIDNLMSQPVQPNEIELFCSRADDMASQLGVKLDDVKQLVEEGESLCDKECDFTDEIEKVVDEVIAMKETVEDRLQQLNNYTRNLKAYADFSDKVTPLMKTLNNIEHKLSVMPTGSSIEQIDQLVQEIEAQSNIFDKAGTRFEQCKSAAANAKATLPSGHPLLEQIADRLRAAEQLMQKVESSINNAKLATQHQRQYLQFVIDDIEVNDFIQAQSTNIASCFQQQQQQQEQDSTSKSDQLRKLQDYKNAVDSHTSRITNHIANGKALANSRGPRANQIKELITGTEAQWRKLLQLCADQEKALESARVYLRFLADCDKLQQSMLKVKPLLDSYQTNRDEDMYSYIYEALQEFTIDQARIDALRAECNQLVKDPNADKEAVLKRTDKVGRLWDELKVKLALCRQELAAKVKYNRFTHAAAEISKDLSTLSESVANCRPVKQERQRCKEPKLVAEAIKRNSSIRDTEVKKYSQLLAPLKAIAEEFDKAKIYPETKQTYADLEADLDKLRRSCAEKDRDLQDERRYAVIVDGVKQFADWVEEFNAGLKAEPRALNQESMEKRLNRSKDREAEMNRQLESADYLRSRAADLANQSEEYAELLQPIRQQLDSERQSLKQCHAEYSDNLAQDAQFVEFLAAAERLQRRLRTVEAQLLEPGAVPLHAEVKQLGAGLADMQEEFEPKLKGNRNWAQYEETLASLSQLYDTVQRLNESIDQQHVAIDKFNAFMQHCDNFQSRLKAKLQLLDETIQPEEMNKKRIERYSTMLAEVTNYNKQLQQLSDDAKQLLLIVDASKQKLVEQRLQQLQQLHSDTESRCSRQLAVAQSAYAAKLLLGKCDDLDQFCQNAEDRMEANSAFDSLAKAKQAQKDHEGLVVDLDAREASLKEIADSLDEFKETDASASRLQDRHRRLQKRFNELRQSAEQCTDNSAYAIKVFHFLAEADDEVAWIDSKVGLVDSDNAGASTSEVQRMKKRLAQFNEEFNNRRQVVEEVVAVGQTLLESPIADSVRERSNSIDSSISSDSAVSTNRLHFKEAEVRRQLNRLRDAYSALDARAKSRQLLLEAAERRFTYADNVAEAKAWLEERMPLVRSIDLGEDEFVCLSRCKLVETLATDVEKFEERVTELASVAQQLRNEPSGFDQTLEKRQDELEKLLEMLDGLLKHYKVKLEQNLKFFDFKERIEELRAWIRSVEIQFNSIEPGADEESCEKAIEKCKRSQALLKTRQEKLDSIDTQYHSLQSDKSFRLDEAKRLKDALKNQLAAAHLSAKEKMRSLEDSRKIHHFLYETACLHEAMEEKLLQVESLSRYGTSLSSNEELVRSLEIIADSEIKPVIAKRTDLFKQSQHLLDEFKATEAEKVMREEWVDMERLWQELNAKIEQKRAELLAAREVHSSLLKSADLLLALQRLLNEIIAEDLAKEYKQAVEQLERSTQRGRDLQQRELQVSEFNKAAARCRRDCQFMADYIDAKSSSLNQVWQQVQQLQQQRHQIYTENADIRRVLDRCQQFNRWLDGFGEDFANCAPSFEHKLEQLDSRGERSEQLTALLMAQRPRVEALAELTLLERRFEEQRKQEPKRTKSMAYNEMAAGLKKRETQRQHMTPTIKEEEQPQQPQSTGRPVSELAPSTMTTTTTPSTATAAATTTPAAETPALRKRGLHKSHTFNTQKKQSKVRSRLSDLMPPSIEGEMEVRQEFQVGGLKHPIKKWKRRFSALCGHQLAVFKDRNAAYTIGDSALHSLVIYSSRCDMDPEHKHSLRLTLKDGSQYLLMLATTQDCLAWQGQLKFKAGLDPSHQLVEFNEADEEAAETGAAASHDTERHSSEYRPRSALRSDASASTPAASPTTKAPGQSLPPASAAAATTAAAAAPPRSPSLTMSPEMSTASAASSGKSRAAQLRAAEGHSDHDNSSEDEGHGQSQTMPRLTVTADTSGEAAAAAAAGEAQKDKKKGGLFRMFSGRKKKDKQ